jgi:hypothetical protein
MYLISILHSRILFTSLQKTHILFDMYVQYIIDSFIFISKV